ncbi:Uncharacterized protein APZ42_025636 [Daphnia magna]|uniref:Uncharacterized protein n=1 Tax=Daphnia magna TaxID=35525 RepID=A0A164SWA3_9CRUS|nr:Uncharacterized protein APZ42_025636 [Daphnia magna]
MKANVSTHKHTANGCRRPRIPTSLKSVAGNKVPEIQLFPSDFQELQDCLNQ